MSNFDLAWEELSIVNEQLIGKPVLILKNYILPPAYIITFAQEQNLIRNKKLWCREYGTNVTLETTITDFHRQYTQKRFPELDKTVKTLSIGNCINGIYARITGQIIRLTQELPTHPYRFYLKFKPTTIEPVGKGRNIMPIKIYKALTIECKKIQLIE